MVEESLLVAAVRAACLWGFASMVLVVYAVGVRPPSLTCASALGGLNWKATRQLDAISPDFR